MPVTEISAPATITAAPTGPTTRLAASASGRCEVASSGNVPMHTSWISTYNAATTTIAVSNADGTVVRGSFVSPAGIPPTSKPMNANATMNTACEKSLYAGGVVNE